MDDTAPAFHALTADDTLDRLASRREGLSDTEARERLARHGPNELRAARPVSVWKILVDQLRSVVVLLLFAAAAVSLAVGDWIEAIAIGAVLLVNTLLGFVTELRARRAMEALLQLETPHAVVLRDGQPREIDAREVVPGDVLRVEAGQAIPADARVIEATDLRTEEAALTGESLPVGKSADPVPRDAPLPDRHDMLWKGTTVATGTARAVVTGTGMGTELGRIGGLVSGIEEERTPLERRLDVLGRRLVWLALAVGVAVVAIGLLRDMELARLIETGIALAIAAVPEGLPAVSTIALAVGVRRMARRQALVRRLPSVETLGSVTVVCTDKTGTLTAGQMTVTTLLVAGRTIDVEGVGYAPDGAFREDDRELAPADDEHLALALRIAMLANRADIERTDEGWVARGDPTEAALLVAARKAGLERERLLEERPEEGEVPFSSERMLMATFHRDPGGGLLAYVKGAPDRVLEQCSHELTPDGERPLDDTARDALLERNRTLASRGLRVLALACALVERADESQLDRLVLVGFAGMMDPPAAGVHETIRVFRDAGIRTVMITGDQQATAEAVARELEILDAGDEVLNGRDLVRMDEQELVRRVAHVAAFSRVSPEDKLEIVTAYQQHGEIVAMLGDGVNDAAALRKADVGVAMGLRGTDVAKEAAAVVLQDDRFRTIGAAVEEGRVIFDNIRKFVFYLFSCNVSEVLILLGAAVAGLPLPLLPLQILWLNLVTDTFPALALAVEPAEPDVMRRPPRDPEQAILSARFLRSIALYSVLITAATLGAFLYALGSAPDAMPRALTMSFMTLALAQAFHLGNARSRWQVLTPARALANRYAVGALVLVLALQMMAMYVPLIAEVLQIERLGARDWAIVLGLAVAPAVLGQIAKVVAQRRTAVR